MEEKSTIESLLRDLFTPIIEQAVDKAIVRHYSALEQPKQPLPELMDVKMAANYLHFSVPTLYGLTHKRMIPYCKRGKRLLFRLEDLEKWVAGSRHQTIDEIRADALNSLASGRRKK